MSKETINELRGLLREADKKAQAGDAQAQTDAQGIFNQIQYLESQAQQQAGEEYPPIIAGAVGEGALLTGKGVQFLNQVRNLPKVVQDVAANQKEHNQVLADMIKQNQMLTDRGIGDNQWTRGSTGISPVGSQMNQSSLQRAQGMMEAINPGGPAAGGSIYNENIILTPDVKAERKAAMDLRNARIAEELKQASIMGKMGKYGRALGSLGGKALEKANPWLQAFSIPYEAVDAYNKFNRGDVASGALSTLGTGAGIASMYPPLTVPMGALSLGAHGADWALDEYRKRKGQAQQGYEQQPAQYAIGGLVFRR
jgi:hypothetical protein